MKRAMTLRVVLASLALFLALGSAARADSCDGLTVRLIRGTGASLAGLLDDFDASHECKEVTCLYNDVNWWLEGLIEDPGRTLEVGEESRDHFL